MDEPFDHSSKALKKKTKKRKLEESRGDAERTELSDQDGMNMDEDVNLKTRHMDYQYIKYIGVQTFEEVSGFFDLVDNGHIIISLRSCEVFCFKGMLIPK